MRNNTGRRAEDNLHEQCSVHYQFVTEVAELNKTIAVIGEGLKWMKQIGRWLIPTLLALSITFGSSMITIAVKVAELDNKLKSITEERTNNGE
jgi:hypothetical protein